jgi:hypothetical protein
LHPSILVSTIHSAVLGINSFHEGPAVTSPKVLEQAGIKAGRFPGGSLSDQYEWSSNALCSGSPYAQSNVTFDDYMEHTAIPAGLDVEITTNYGSSDVPACDRPGSASDAAAWVNYANNTKHYGIKWWEIGNEVWGSYERDLHTMPHDPATYASTSKVYYSEMKAADPTINVSVVLNGYGTSWDAAVLANGSYDYVSYHDYFYGPGEENDTTLLHSGPATFRKSIGVIKSELASVGKASTPISISEYNSVFATPGKQSVSIVNGLYAGEMLGELMSAGIRRAEFWDTFGCEWGGGGNSSPTLYGWQTATFGSLGAFSEGVPFVPSEPESSGCEYVSSSVETIPYGTPFPTGRAMQLYGKTGFVTEGEHIIGKSVSASLPNVEAYAATHGSDYSLMLINLDQNTPATFPVSIDGLLSGSGYTYMRYGRAQYDQTRNNGPWVGSITGSGGAWAGSITVNLPPWSMTEYTIAASGSDLAKRKVRVSPDKSQ